MSYHTTNESEDSLNQFFTKAAEFAAVSNNLLNANSFASFELWFEKLYAIDRRLLYFFLCDHYDEFSPAYIERAQTHYKKNIQKRIKKNETQR